MAPHFVHDTPQFQYGVITGISANLEFMLPWWWWNYQQYNSYPVLFLDFGLSDKGKKWCSERGLLSPFIESDFVKKEGEINPDLINDWKKLIAGDPLSARSEWFKKPVGLLHSPFETTLWIDLDCEVRSSLNHIFSLVESSQKIGMARDQFDGLSGKNVIYNSGVLGFPFHSPLILKWAEKTIHENALFMGDQDVISSLLSEDPGAVIELSKADNMHFKYAEEPINILHFQGYEGKIELIKKIVSQPYTSFFNPQELFPN